MVKNFITLFISPKYNVMVRVWQVDTWAWQCVGGAYNKKCQWKL